MGDALVKGLLLGLSTGGFCLGACAPVILPYLVSRQWEGPRAAARRTAEFLTGRLLAYLVFAMLVVWLGARVQTSPVATRAAAAAMALLAVALVLHGLSLSFPEWKTCRALERSGVLRRFPFLAGLALGITVCPPLMLAFTYLLTVGWGSGVGFAVAFFLGTTVYLVPLFVSGYLSRVPSLRGAAEVAAVFSGVWFLVQAVALWGRG
ncbi:MAG: sulfite exporter TauE/SafE family protein [Armatimonadota bacterium]